MSAAPEILTETVDDGVLLVTLNRPERYNALTSSMVDAYIQALDDADSDPGIRVIVVTGAGRGFCAGADTGGLAEADGAQMEEHATKYPRDRAMNLSKPLIAVVNGPVAGAGLAHALMADVRIASTTATITTAFARFGLIAEYGTAFLLSRVIGSGGALDLLLSSRKVAAEESLRLGVWQQLWEAEEVVERGIEYARTIAANSPHSLREIKDQVRLDRERGWSQSFADANERMNTALQRTEFRERATAAAQKGARS